MRTKRNIEKIHDLFFFMREELEELMGKGVSANQFPAGVFMPDWAPKISHSLHGQLRLTLYLSLVERRLVLFRHACLSVFINASVIDCFFY